MDCLSKLLGCQQSLAFSISSNHLGACPLGHAPLCLSTIALLGPFMVQFCYGKVLSKAPLLVSRGVRIGEAGRLHVMINKK